MKNKIFLFLIILCVICYLIINPVIVFIHHTPYFTFTKKLDLSNKYNVEYNYTKELYRFKFFKEVEYLNILSCNIPNIEFITSMKNLKTLLLGKVEDNNLSYLNQCNNITELYCWYNNIENLEFISNMENLEKLDLLESNTKNIDALRNLHKLQEFYIRGEDINDISCLGNSHDLRILAIQYTSVSDLNILENNTQLEKLSISLSHKITNLDILPKLTKLKELYISQINVKDYSPILKMSNLKKLTINKGALTKEELKILRENGVTVIEIGE